MPPMEGGSAPPPSPPHPKAARGKPDNLIRSRAQTCNEAPDSRKEFDNVLDSIRQDLGRLREEDPSLRGLVRGVTSPAFWAIVVYRVFNWCHRKRLPVMPIRVLV